MSLESLSEEEPFKSFFEKDFSIEGYAQHLLKSNNTELLERSVDTLNVHIKNHVSQSQLSIVSQANNISDLSRELSLLDSSVKQISQRLTNLRSHLHEPYQLLESRVHQLENVQHTTHVLRKVVRFFNLSGKLRQYIKSNVGGQAKAAEILESLDKLRVDGDLKGISVVDNEIEWILSVRQNLLKTADRLLVTGCASQNQSDTVNACQIYFSLKCLKEVVMENFEKMKRKSWGAIEGCLGQVTKLSEAETDVPELWKQMELLFQELYQQTLQVLHLQRVLQRLPHPENPKENLWSVVNERSADSNEKDEDLLVFIFWKDVTSKLSSSLRKASQDSNFVGNQLVVDYPKVMRIVFDFLGRLETHQELRQSYHKLKGLFKQEQKSMLINAFSWCEAGYIKKMTNQLENLAGKICELRFNEVPEITNQNVNFRFVGQFSSVLKSNIEVVYMGEETKVLILPKLLLGLSKVLSDISKSMKDQIVNTTQINMVGSQVNPSYIRNAIIFNISNRLVEDIQAILIGHNIRIQITETNEHNEKDSENLTQNSLIQMSSSLGSNVHIQSTIIKPIFEKTFNQLNTILSSIFKEDFTSSSLDPQNMKDSPMGMCSPYVTQLHQQIQQFSTTLLPLFTPCKLLREHLKELVERVASSFLLYASMLRPLGEGGKLKLTSDMAQIELSLTPICTFKDVPVTVYHLESGKPHTIPLSQQWHSFRSLIYTEDHKVLEFVDLENLHPSYTLHHLFSRMPMDLAFPALPASPFQSVFSEQVRYGIWIRSLTNHDLIAAFSGQLKAYMVLVNKRGDTQYPNLYPVLDLLCRKLNKAFENKTTK